MKITKKLRDVTKEEFKGWSKANCSSELCPQCPFNCVICFTGGNRTWINNKDLYSDKFLDQTIEIEVPDILTKEEKEYLSTVIKPFRDKVKHIKKVPSTWYEDKAWIEIVTLAKGTNIYHRTQLPYFDKERMYVNMNENREYKLEELGL